MPSMPTTSVSPRRLMLPGAYSTAIPVIAGCLMIVASVLPWLNDPLGSSYNAWSIPVDIGWQLRSSIVNYGLLSLCCALFTFWLAYKHWRWLALRSFVGAGYTDASTRMALLAGVSCLVPIMLFFWQYIFVDLRAMDTLAQHKVQMLLIVRHFGYKGADSLLHVRAVDVSASTLVGRTQLLADQISIGLIFPVLSAWILIGLRHLFAHPAPLRRSRRWYAGVAIGVTCLLAVVLGRSLLTTLYDYQAKIALAQGNYTGALQELDVARLFNPVLDEVSYYHIQRGQAWYFLHGGVEMNDDSHLYLAYVYREQEAYIDAYKELLTVWHAQPTTPWIVSEVSLALTYQAESVQSGNISIFRLPDTPLIPRSGVNEATLPWVQLLVATDSTNVYGRYLLGRILCSTHSYDACRIQMNAVLQLSNNTDVKSSAYTYMALSMIERGDITAGRELLIKAIQFDPGYLNNTAREELSGLH